MRLLPLVPAHDSIPLLETLTPREREVIMLMAEGRSNKEIGVILEVATETARNHTVNVMVKLDTVSRGEASRIWWEARIALLEAQIEELRAMLGQAEAA